MPVFCTVFNNSLLSIPVTVQDILLNCRIMDFHYSANVVPKIEETTQQYSLVQEVNFKICIEISNVG